MGYKIAGVAAGRHRAVDAILSLLQPSYAKELPVSAQTSVGSGQLTISTQISSECSDPEPAGDCSSYLAVRPWDYNRFTCHGKLQDASRNEGSVLRMHDAQFGDSGGFVAVKRMPLTLTQRDAASFVRAQPHNAEQPWTDIEIVGHLTRRGCPWVCELHGVFMDSSWLYVVSSLANEGDLFEWCGNITETPGVAREAVIRPVVRQLCGALRALHGIGVSHRDVSMENVVLHREMSGKLRVKLVDFGMATRARESDHEIRGKYTYQAPEMHRGRGLYDGFLADAFSTGVLIFCLAIKSYPWGSTRRGSCRSFDLLVSEGFAIWIHRRKVPGTRGQMASDVVSLPLIHVLKGFIELEPSRRLTFGEDCWKDSPGKRCSVWDCSWLGEPAADDKYLADPPCQGPTSEPQSHLNVAAQDKPPASGPSVHDVGPEFDSHVLQRSGRMGFLAEDGPQFDAPPAW